MVKFEEAWQLIPKGLMSGVLVGVGILFCFFGLRLFRPTMALTGLLAGGYLSYSLLHPIQWWEWLLVVGAGVVGAAVCSWLWSVALMALGALSFASLSGVLMAWMNLQPPVRVAGMAMAGLVGATLALALQRPLVIFGTAAIGALLMGMAGDVWWDWGLREALRVDPAGINPWIMGLLGTVALFGIGVQWMQFTQQEERLQQLPK